MSDEVYEADSRRHEDWLGALHWPKPDRLEISRCGVDLGGFVGWDPTAAPADRQCNRNGCRQAWDRWAANA